MITVNIPENAKKIIAMLEEHGFDAYIVGGCVRDACLMRTPDDWDITTSAKPEQIKEIFRRTVDTGIEHGTVTVLMKDDSYEVTTYRIDGIYGDGRHPDSVEYTSDLKEDLRRRDFTINAMAYSDRAGLVDEYGGINDLAEKLIRCVGDPNERFTEDALRILRAVRFACQLDFEIEKETYNAIGNHIDNLRNVSKERIFVELNKALLSKCPQKMSLIWKLGMNECICDSFSCIPEASSERLAGAEFLPRAKHMRWAALMQDITPDEAGAILRQLKSDNDTIDKVMILVREMQMKTPTDSIGLRRLLSHIGPELAYDLAELKRRGYGKNVREDYDLIVSQLDRILGNGDCYNLAMLAIKGEDLINTGMKPGPEIGDKLNELLNLVIESPELNSKESLKRYL